MNKSIWVIFAFGILAVGSMVVAMMIGLENLNEGEAGNRVKLGNEIKDVFDVEDVGVLALDKDDKRILRITYRTERNTDYDLQAQLAEIEKISTYAGKHYNGKDRKQINEFFVIRTEVLHRGCWTGTEVTEATHPNPHWVDPNISEEYRRFNQSAPR